MRAQRTLLVALCLLLGTAPACSTLRGVTALRNVEFSLGPLAAAHLVGIDVQRISSVDDLTPVMTARLFAALAGGNVPLELDLRVLALNPGGSAAALTRMDWSLVLAGRETVRGALDRAHTIAPGGTTEIPVRVSVNLVEFFGRNLPELIQLAAAVAGESDQAVEVALRVQPTLDTALGPIRFPAPLTLVRESVGGRPRVR